MNTLVILGLSLLALAQVFIFIYIFKENTASLHAQKFASKNGLTRPVQSASELTIATIIASFQLYRYIFFIRYHECN